MLEEIKRQLVGIRLRPDALGSGGLQFRRLLETLPVGAYMCDPQGLITYFNPRALELWGRAPKLNDHEDRFCGSFKLRTPSGTLLFHEQCWMARALRENLEYNGHEIVIERPDGSRRNVLAYANPIRDESANLLGAVNLLVDISERRQAELERERLLLDLDAERTRLSELTANLEERVSQRTAQVRNLAAALNFCEQRERARIAQVLHDDLQQLMCSQLLRVDAIRRELPDELQSSLADVLDGMREQMQQAIRVSRILVTELKPPEMKTNHLSEALWWLAGHMREAHGLQVRFTPQEAGEINNTETRGVLVQMVSELLFNVVKHAETKEAELALYRENGELVLRVEDRGRGFDAGTLLASGKEGGGFGLRGISDRLVMIGGQLSIDSIPGVGTRVALRICGESSEVGEPAKVASAGAGAALP